MNEEIECTAKKWGSSIGIIIPKTIVDKEKIKPEEKIRITVKRTPTAEDLWELGPIQEKTPTQKIKDDLRKGW